MRKIAVIILMVGMIVLSLGVGNVNAGTAWGFSFGISSGYYGGGYCGGYMPIYTPPVYYAPPVVYSYPVTTCVSNYYYRPRVYYGGAYHPYNPWTYPGYRRHYHRHHHGHYHHGHYHHGNTYNYNCNGRCNIYNGRRHGHHYRHH